MEREVARAKVTANRVATVVANEWKDANDKLMPVKQWLEERRFFQASNMCSMPAYHVPRINSFNYLNAVQISLF